MDFIALTFKEDFNRIKQFKEGKGLFKQFYADADHDFFVNNLSKQSILIFLFGWFWSLLRTMSQFQLLDFIEIFLNVKYD